MSFSRILLAPLAALALAGAAASAHAQPYPTKPVRMVVPVPPGGGTDFLARTLSVAMSDRMGQTFVVDNRSGAGGTMGAQIAAGAAPDGYTIMMAYTASHGINPALTPLPYDPVRNFTPISLVAAATNMLVVHPSIEAKSVQELVTLARSKPGRLRYASAGVGTAPHMSGELFNLMAKTDLVHVPYKGAGPALVDVLAGKVELTFTSLPAGLPHGKAGKLRMLAVTSLKRSTVMPELPTVAESGLAGFTTDQWYGIVGPSGLPDGMVTRLHREIVSSLKDREVVDKVRGQGFDIVGGTPAQFRQHIRSEVQKWKDVVKKTGIKAG